MKIIWYNPDENKFEFGTPSSYHQQKSHSQQSMNFRILYEFNSTSERLIDRVLNTLTSNYPDPSLITA